MSQDPLTALAQDMATATSWIVGEIAGVLDGTLRITTTPDFANSRFVTSYAIVFAASSILMVVLWLLAVIKRAVAGVGPLRAMSEATGPLWLAVAASAFTPVAIAGLVSITDALTDAVATPIGSPTGYLKSLASQIQPDSKPFLSIILDLLVFMAALMLAMELIIRAALLYMAVALAPAFYAGLVDRALWHHIKSWAGAILAFDFVKPITILMLALAKGVSSALSTTPSTNLSSLMIGMTILYSCVYLSTRVYQFVPFIGDELNSWGMRDLTFRALNRANRLTKPARRAAGQAARAAGTTAADRMKDGINAHAKRESGTVSATADGKPNLTKPIVAAAAGAVGVAAAAHAAPLIAGAAAAHGAGAVAAGIAAHGSAAGVGAGVAAHGMTAAATAGLAGHAAAAGGLPMPFILGSVGAVEGGRRILRATPINARPMTGTDQGDIPVDTNGMVHPPSVENLASRSVYGLSVYDTVSHMIAAGVTSGKVREPSTPLPEGLGFIADGRDAGGARPDGHGTIYPTRVMPYTEYQSLIKQMEWKNVDPPNDLKKIVKSAEGGAS